MKRGFIKTTKLSRKYDPEPHYEYNSFDGYTNIQVCSSNALPEHKRVSPMRLGPIITGDPELPECKIMENYWQWMKVHKCEVISLPPTNKNITKFFNYPYFDDSPDEEYLENRKNWFNSTKADLNRMREDKKNRHNFIYCWYDGQKIYDYIMCRKAFYCFVYAAYVKEEPAYQLIKNRLDSGESLCLTGWDAFEWSEEADPNCEEIKEVLNDKNKVFGHEMVLAGMLLGNRI